MRSSFQVLACFPTDSKELKEVKPELKKLAANYAKLSEDEQVCAGCWVSCA